jgi:hypothetical protein
MSMVCVDIPSNSTAMESGGVGGQRCGKVRERERDRGGGAGMARDLFFLSARDLFVCV